MLAIQPTNMTIAEYCGAMERKDIIVNKTYQRSDKVWPDSARSFLIESGTSRISRSQNIPSLKNGP